MVDAESDDEVNWGGTALTTFNLVETDSLSGVRSKGSYHLVHQIAGGLNEEVIVAGSDEEHQMELASQLATLKWERKVLASWKSAARRQAALGRASGMLPFLTYLT
jgi:hypothetical protein